MRRHIGKVGTRSCQGDESLSPFLKISVQGLQKHSASGRACNRSLVARKAEFAGKSRSLGAAMAKKFRARSAGSTHIYT